MKPVVVGVSSCLLGHKVRYDGNDKRNDIVENEICTYFHCVPLCPEYAIGLGVPRDPVQLTQGYESHHVVSLVDRSMDITVALQQYADFVCSTLPLICGYIFKARSPSCGLVDTPLYNYHGNEHGNEVGKSRGAYAAQIIHRLHNLPVIDENQLADQILRHEFIQKVESYSLYRK